jgi:hypothetical protein
MRALHLACIALVAVAAAQSEVLAPRRLQTSTSPFPLSLLQCWSIFCFLSVGPVLHSLENSLLCFNCNRFSSVLVFIAVLGTPCTLMCTPPALQIAPLGFLQLARPAFSAQSEVIVSVGSIQQRCVQPAASASFKAFQLQRVRALALLVTFALLAHKSATRLGLLVETLLFFARRCARATALRGRRLC